MQVFSLLFLLFLLCLSGINPVSAISTTFTTLTTKPTTTSISLLTPVYIHHALPNQYQYFDRPITLTVTLGLTTGSDIYTPDHPLPPQTAISTTINGTVTLFTPSPTPVVTTITWNPSTIPGWLRTHTSTTYGPTPRSTSSSSSSERDGLGPNSGIIGAATGATQVSAAAAASSVHLDGLYVALFVITVWWVINGFMSGYLRFPSSVLNFV